MDLQANTVSFSDSLSKMSQLSLSTSKNVQRSLSYMSTAASAMAASIVGSLALVIDKAEDFTFSIQKMAEQTGTTTEMFSKLAYSAKLSGTPVESLAGAMEKLSRTAGAARSGSKEQASAFNAIGISLKDLNGPLNDAGNLTVAVAKKMNGYADSTNKTALEQKLFGRSGAELAPLLKQLATGFDTASEQATLFGVVIGDKSAAQARKLHESMTQLESVSLGFGLRLASGVAPALETVADKLLRVATSADGMKKIDAIAVDVAKAISLAGDAVEYFAGHTTAVKHALEGVAALQVASIFLPMVSSATKANMGLDSIGLSAIKMVGKVSGVSAVLPVLKSVTSAVQLQAFMVAGLAREEGIATAATYALSNAWKTLSTAIVANPVTVALGLMAGAAYVFNAALNSDIDSSKKFGDSAVEWKDKWAAAIDQTKDSFKPLRDMILGAATGNQGLFTQGLAAQHTRPSFGERAHQEANMRDMFARANAFDPSKVMSGDVVKLKAAPALPKPQTERVDQLKLKLDELAASAKDAMQTLQDAGKGVDFQRANEITKEYDKTVIELEAHLKAQGKALSDADKATIRSSIATRINDISQAGYIDQLVKATEELQASAKAQDMLTNAIGKGANASRDAAIQANALKRDAGKSDDWKRNNAGMRASDDAAFGAQFDKANANTSKTAVVGIQAQIDAQMSLNVAILAGRDAMNAAHLAAEQNAIRQSHESRGNVNQSALNAELDANEKLFRAKQSEQDLTRAATMDAARLYNDEAAAIRGAAQAARDAGHAISDMQIKAANKDAWMQYLAAVDKTTLAVGSASQGVGVFFREMSRDTTSAAQQVHDILGGAFESLNSTVEKMVETHTRTLHEFSRSMKNNFADMFRGIGGNLAKMGAQKLEGSVAGSILGKFGGSDPTVQAVNKSNMYLASILTVLTASKVAGAISATAGAASSAAGASASAGSGSLFAGMLGLMLGGFGGHRAIGGDVTAGMSYDVGEMGRETFTPTVNGKITPNNKLGGGGLTIGHIDARGSNDPAQTEAAIHRALAIAGPQIAAGAIRAAAEKRSRSASGVR